MASFATQVENLIRDGAVGGDTLMLYLEDGVFVAQLGDATGTSTEGVESAVEALTSELVQIDLTERAEEEEARLLRRNAETIHGFSVSLGKPAKLVPDESCWLLIVGDTFISSHRDLDPVKDVGAEEFGVEWNGE